MVSPTWIDANGDNKHDIDGLDFNAWATALAAQNSSGYSGSEKTVVISPGVSRTVGRPGSPSVITTPDTDSAVMAKAKFRGGLAAQDEYTWQIADFMFQSGIISIDPRSSQRGIDQAIKVYENAVDIAADVYAFGDRQKSVMDFLSFAPGNTGSGAGGTSVSKQVQNYTPDQARQKAINAYKSILNRMPTDQEIAEFSTGLINSAKNTPSVQRVSSKGGASVQETTQGFDEKTWTLGFMASKIPANMDLGGLAGAAQDSLKSLSEAYGVRLSSDLGYGLIRDLIEGKIDQAAVEQVYREQAKILYPHLSDKIDAGVNPRQIADPYIRNTMSILEKSSTEADMFSSYIREALNYKDENGNYVLPNVDEHARMLRGKEEWLTTNNGKESLMSATDNILRQMGFE